VTSNQQVFGTVEFGAWAHRTALIPAERFLVERYLEPSGRTLEAGTGSGRLLFALQALGFSSLAGFDFVPELLAEARKRDGADRIRFDEQNAASLSYGDGAFDQLIYLQQVLCFIEYEGARRSAVREAYRVLRAGGTAVFSLLSFEARSGGALYRAYLAYLRVVRSVRRSSRPQQSLPWLRLGGRFNPGALLDARPYVYWYRLDEICRLLTEVGFMIDALGSTRQILEARMVPSPEALAREPIEGMLYIVARK